MTFVALSIPDWPTGAAATDLPARLLDVAPRAAVSPAEGIAWLDARSLDPQQIATRAKAALHESGIVIAGMAAAQIPVVAAVASRQAVAGEQATIIAAGSERDFFSPLPLTVLGGNQVVHHLLFGVGITRCGELARLSRESVEVRLGREGLTLWRLARADDPRPLFSARPRELPTASLDWTEFSTTDLEQLVFVLHSLLKTVCDHLVLQGVGARTLEVTLALENRRTLTEQVTAARSTSQRTTWLRLVRRKLEKLTLPDRVAGLAIRVIAAGPPTIRQGDFFDLGFASAEAAESAVSHILDLQHDAVVALQRSGHALPERRIAWVASELAAERREPAAVANAASPPVTPLILLLLPVPREITVSTVPRRGFPMPVRYTDNAISHPLRESLGPHCISGDRWAERIAREYHQCVRADGTVVLLFREVTTERWYLAGWWD